MNEDKIVYYLCFVKGDCPHGTEDYYTVKNGIVTKNKTDYYEVTERIGSSFGSKFQYNIFDIKKELCFPDFEKAEKEALRLIIEVNKKLVSSLIVALHRVHHKVNSDISRMKDMENKK